MFGVQQVPQLSMRPSRNLYYGWSRNADGQIDNWHQCMVSNTITQSSASSGTQRPIVAVVYETL